MSRATVEELRARWDAGEPQAAIAAALGVSVATVQRLRRAHGIARRRAPVDAAEAVRLYCEGGLGVEVVAARLGCSTSAVRYVLGRADVAMRAPGANGRDVPTGVRAEALRRYAAGDSVARICTDLGIGESSLARWRQAAGLPARPAGRASRTPPA